MRVRAERFETPGLGTGLTPRIGVGVPVRERTELIDVADPALLGAWLVAGDWPREVAVAGARTGAGDRTDIEEGNGVVLEVAPVVLPAVPPVRDEEAPPDDDSAFRSASSLAISFSLRRSWMACVWSSDSAASL